MSNYPLRYVDGSDTHTVIDPRVGTDPNVGPLNVKAFGASGDGIADDTIAIQLAVSALDAERGGVIHIPAGRYKVTSPIHLDRPVILTGAGMGDHLATGDHGSVSGSGGTWDLASQGSAIVTTSSTLTAIHVDYPGCTIIDLAVVNSRVAEPTEGAGIRVELGNGFRMQRVRIVGFYDNLSFEQSEYATLSDCLFTDPARYGLYARNLYHVDQGDMSVVGCAFGFSGYRGTTGADAAIRLESGGGLRFVSSKVNCGPPPSHAKFIRGIDIDVSGGVTGVVLVTGSSIENVTTGIRIVGTINNIAITGNEMSGLTSGIYVDGPDRVIVTGNVLTDTTVGVEFRNVAAGIIGANLGGSVVLGAGNTAIQTISTV